LPSIPQAVSQAYRDLGHALRTIPNLAAIAFVIIVASDIVLTGLIPANDPQPTRRLLLSFIGQCARGFLLTPYLIAVHRLIILGETAKAYTFTPRELRFRVFFGWTLALQVVSMLPAFIIRWVPAPTRSHSWMMLLITLSILAALLRLSIVFPAAAVDSPGATFEAAMADTKGHAWRILLVTALVFVGFLLPVGILANLAGIDGTPSLTPVGIFNAFASGVLGLAMVTLMVVIASRFYLWIGNRTKGAAAAPD
jgi:hypothetical protein